MKTLLAFLFCFPALAAVPGYKLDVKFSLDGKDQTYGRVGVKEGGQGKIENKQTFVEVNPRVYKMEDGEAIMLDFVVGSIDEKGKRTVISRPKLLVQENEETTYSVDELELMVRANKTKF